MKKTLIATTVAAVLAASALPVLAQGIKVDAGAGATVDTPVVDAAVGASAQTSASVDSYNTVKASIAGSASVDLSAVTDEAQVSIVLLSSLEGDAAAGGTALDEALSASADAAATVQANVEGNAAIKAKLEAEGHTSADVVAVKANADGSVVVFVDDRA